MPPLYPMMASRELMGGSSPDAEYMLARTEAAVHVPSDVDPAAFAPMLCAGVTTFNSMRNMGIKPGSLVAIQGLGGLGHLAIQFAVRMGFRVVALSSSAGKEDFARRLGASHYIDSSKQNAAEVLAGMGGAALILTTIPGSPEIIEPLIHGLRPHGTLCILGRKYSPSSRCPDGGSTRWGRWTLIRLS